MSHGGWNDIYGRYRLMNIFYCLKIVGVVVVEKTSHVINEVVLDYLAPCSTRRSLDAAKSKSGQYD